MQLRKHLYSKWEFFLFDESSDTSNDKIGLFDAQFRPQRFTLPRIVRKLIQINSVIDDRERTRAEQILPSLLGAGNEIRCIPPTDCIERSIPQTM